MGFGQFIHEGVQGFQALGHRDGWKELGRQMGTKDFWGDVASKGVIAGEILGAGALLLAAPEAAPITLELFGEVGAGALLDTLGGVGQGFTVGSNLTKGVLDVSSKRGSDRSRALGDLAKAGLGVAGGLYPEASAEIQQAEWVLGTLTGNQKFHDLVGAGIDTVSDETMKAYEKLIGLHQRYGRGDDPYETLRDLLSGQHGVHPISHVDENMLRELGFHSSLQQSWSAWGTSTSQSVPRSGIAGTTVYDPIEYERVNRPQPVTPQPVQGGGRVAIM